jgi:hypothetical protein
VLPAYVFIEDIDSNVTLDAIFDFKELNGALVEHIFKRKVFLNEFELLILAHLLHLGALDFEIVGFLESSGVGRHGFTNYTASFQLLLNCRVIVFKTVLPQLFLNLRLLDRLPQKG